MMWHVMEENVSNLQHIFWGTECSVAEIVEERSCFVPFGA